MSAGNNGKLEGLHSLAVQSALTSENDLMKRITAVAAGMVPAFCVLVTQHNRPRVL